MYTVKEVSQMLDMSSHTIRYYTNLGLVPTLQRDENNNRRIFNDKSIGWLRAIQHLRNGGMSVQAVKEYFELCLVGDSTVPQRYRIIMEQKAMIEKKLKEIEACAAFLNHKAEYYTQLMTGEISDDTSNPDKW